MGGRYPKPTIQHWDPTLEGPEHGVCRMADGKGSRGLCPLRRHDPDRVVEAKRKSKNVSAAIDQAERYAKGIKSSNAFTFAGGPWDEYRVPFVFAANGRPYLKQIETESGIWFRDTRRSTKHRRALVGWPTPAGLSGLLEVNQGAADTALKAQPFEFGFPLRPS